MIFHEIVEHLYEKSERLFELVQHMVAFSEYCPLPTLVRVEFDEPLDGACDPRVKLLGSGPFRIRRAVHAACFVM